MAQIDEVLLAEAREAQAAQTHALAQAELARVRFAQSLRRLHQGGASVRDIGRAVGLSHQRVHQLVDALGWTCSFCGEVDERRDRFVAGPGVKICHACVDRAVAPAPPMRSVRATAKTAACSFCGKRRSQVEAMAEAESGRFRICHPCVALSREILAERA